MSAFLEGTDKADILAPLGGYPNAAETNIKVQAATYAARYAASRSLTVPLRSSVVRGILETGGAAAETFAPAYLVGQESVGLINEISAIRKGDCH